MNCGPKQQQQPPPPKNPNKQQGKLKLLKTYFRGLFKSLIMRALSLNHGLLLSHLTLNRNNNNTNDLHRPSNRLVWSDVWMLNLLTLWRHKEMSPGTTYRDRNQIYDLMIKLDSNYGSSLNTKKKFYCENAVIFKSHFCQKPHWLWHSCYVRKEESLVNS